LNHLERPLADRPSGDPIRDCVDAVSGVDLTFLERLGDACGSLGLHTHYSNIGTLGFDRRRDSGDESTAADGDDDGFDLRELIEDFEPDSSLSGHHRLVVEGVDVRPILAFLNLVGSGLRIIVVSTVEHHAATVPLGGFYFRDRCVFRHYNCRVDARPRGRERDTLGVIPSTGGDDPGVLFGFGQRGDSVDRPSDFERAGSLKVLQFEVDVGAGLFGKRMGVLQGRLASDSRHPICSLLDR